ncbi:MAG: nicotinate phosphoribosyltransferase [Reyranella sp.]|uniref:nicotinate phosphoribosyltransferase n=1 Tax=Reyranella sp. TaxID=1929291 RepID=UPI00273220AD|nr:nicotinate phosphoribosyltransferase [Reyranella sp.]MDP1965948.1 nicotinate phosphoribosyltransferase [Reyranella sp.]MDP2374322.1 nicotinate phosphoribosyltransferase [Reyranella sp.]
MLDHSLLLSDQYQLSMLEAYLAEGMTETAVFEFFVRKLPPRRDFLMAAGLEQLVEFLEGMRYTPDELAWLRTSGTYSSRFIDSLTDLRFTGDVDAMPEGTAFFPNEPVVRVTAPLPEAQLIESRLINLIHFQTLIASTAARMVLAAPGKQLVDFGFRRAHGAEAGLLAARASYLAGFAGTATVAAHREFGIPVFGTMAHSFIQAHDDEATAFERFARLRPAALTLLIDTYDTERAACIVARLAPRLASEHIVIAAVRLDSGDLAAHARAVRHILDEAGLQKVRIFASGGLDDRALLQLRRSAAPIDGFGVGTSLTTSSDAPALDCAYKLQEYAGRPRRKLSEGKATWPGRKQVYRFHRPDGTIAEDVIALVSEPCAGEPLLRPVMRAGRRLPDLPDLSRARSHAAQSLKRLPPPLRQLEVADVPVRISQGLRDLAASMTT